jgi:micrococcal nuclease
MALMGLIAALITGTALAGESTLPPTQSKPEGKAPVDDCRYQYTAQVLRVVDGDTYEVFVDMGMGMFYKTKVRLAGIDTPEVYGKDRDPVRGPAATNAGKAWVSYQPEAKVLFQYHRMDKYGGRVDGELYPIGGGPSLSQVLTEAGHVR